MSGPNYDKYSLDQLYDALNNIDENAFPERAALIRKKIEDYQKPIKKTTDTSEILPDKNNIDFKKYLTIFKNGQNFLFIFSFLVGALYLLNIFTPLTFTELTPRIQFKFLGSRNLEIETLLTIATIIYLTINIGFLISSIGSFLGSRTFKLILIICWGLMAIGFEFWTFCWWPKMQFDFDIGFRFKFLGMALGFKINFVSAFLFTWAMALLPEFRKELEQAY